MRIDLSKVKREKMTIVEDVFRVDHISWEDLYEEDKKKDRLIVIKDYKVITENLRINKESFFNSRFNVPTEVDNKIVEYSCECEKLIGRFNEGQICPECKTVVEVKYNVDLLRRGWIDLGDYKIIIPAIYNKIKAYIGRNKLEEIINISINNGKIDSSNPFKGIGMIEFERRYIEILEFFKHSSNKPELLQVLLDRKDITFSSKIYVMSSVHRPGYLSSKNKSFSYHDINALFVKILTDFTLVSKGRRIGRKAVEIIGNIQQYLMSIYQLSILKLLGKEKLIRSSIISGKMWYSSRMVIVSETSNLGIDNVRMSYKGFIGMFELEIMNCMLRGIGSEKFIRMTTAECRLYLTKCKYSNKVDEDIYQIIDTLLHKRKDDGIWVIINRNPSFDLGSIQCFKIAEVFKDAKKYVLTIPHNSLGEFSGDYDGDVLNVYSPKEKCVVEAFKEGYKPSKLILDRCGGYYNPNMVPIKDEYVFLKSFLDKEYKPIGDDVVLREIKDIMDDIEEPFNYKKVKALEQYAEYRKRIKDGTYFSKEKIKCSPINNVVREKDEFARTTESVTPFNTDKRLTFDILDFIGREDFVYNSK